jgi:antitoxin HigA-1
MHPGEMLGEEVIEPLGLSTGMVARACGEPRTRIERVVSQRLGISSDIRLGPFFTTSTEFWMKLHARCEVLMPERETAEDLGKITLGLPRPILFSSQGPIQPTI